MDNIHADEKNAVETEAQPATITLIELDELTLSGCKPYMWGLSL